MDLEEQRYGDWEVKITDCGVFIKEMSVKKECRISILINFNMSPVAPMLIIWGKERFWMWLRARIQDL